MPGWYSSAVSSADSDLFIGKQFRPDKPNPWTQVQNVHLLGEGFSLGLTDLGQDDSVPKNVGRLREE